MIRGRKGQLMFCFQLNTDDPSVLRDVEQELEKLYSQERGKFSPPLEIINLGLISETTNPFGTTEYVTGACIASVPGANRDWFVDLLKKAVNRVAEKDRRTYSVFTWNEPYLDVIFGKPRP